MRVTVLPLVLLMSAGLAHGAFPDLPARKSGLWSVTTGAPEIGLPPFTFHTCVTPTSDPLKILQRQAERCPDMRSRHEAGRLLIDANCNIDGSNATMKGVFTGSFTSDFKGEMVTRYTPPLKGLSIATVRAEGRWLGTCQPGQRPGEASLPGLGIGGINLEELMNRLSNMRTH